MASPGGHPALLGLPRSLQPGLLGLGASPTQGEKARSRAMARGIFQEKLKAEGGGHWSESYGFLSACPSVRPLPSFQGSRRKGQRPL